MEKELEDVKNDLEMVQGAYEEYSELKSHVPSNCTFYDGMILGALNKLFKMIGKQLGNHENLIM
jgi:hypothetical protein